MKISTKEWFLFILGAFLCLVFWFKFGYSEFAFIDLYVDRKEALYKAESYLKSKGLNPGDYKKAIVFKTDDWADRYLQKTLGFESAEEFIKRHSYDLFAWHIRFFKELQKEEYVIEISPKSGDILGFGHAIEDIELRDPIEKEAARQKAEEFLRKIYGLNFKDYEFHEEKIKRLENRIDYNFSWQKKGVYIPWQEKQGGAKLLIGATISGNEIRGFYKDVLDIPEKFRRYIDNQLNWGEYLSIFSSIALIILVTWSIFIVVKKKHTLDILLCKKWFVSLGILFFIINTASVFNNIQSIIMAYPTSVRFSSFIGLYLIKVIISLIFLSVGFILPGIAGESLRSEVMPDNKYSSFIYYLKTTFYSRAVCRSILFGYLLFFIMLGVQAVIFHLGKNYFGVWREWLKLTQLSSTYLPFFSAFVIGSSASISEELIFRLFGINWAKRYLKSTILAILLTSLIWGVGHAGYAIFPVWFRGIEVTLLGIILGFAFIRYGLISLIVAHYLFDVFWSVAAYIFGHSFTYLFVGSITILAIPLAFAVAAWLINKEEKEKAIETQLSYIQKYNLNILITFLSAKKYQGASAQTMKEELLNHNWDIALIDLAIKEVFKS